jgi:hypothetical protein
MKIKIDLMGKKMIMKIITSGLHDAGLLSAIQRLLQRQLTVRQLDLFKQGRR